jgi:hypothetical protein
MQLEHYSGVPGLDPSEIIVEAMKNMRERQGRSIERFKQRLRV